MRPSTVRMIFIVAVLAAVTALNVAACIEVSTNDQRSTPTVPAGGPEDLAKVWEAYEVLQERYVDRQSLDKEKLAEGAIRGMIATLDDPFTSYFPPRRYQENLELFEGAFQGIGAQVAIRDGHVTVVSPIPDTPADKAGLRAGDIILAVEDQSVEGLTLDEVIDRIRGPKGTPVRLRILQAQTNRIMDLRIVRDEIKNATVTYGLLEGPIARVRLTQFVERTDEDLIRALDELKDQKVRGIVLDLRNNPGGLLRVVIRVASQFLDKGLVLYEVDASGTRTDHAVQGGGDAKTIPLVVLVNGGSASGSEVVAGALQDQRRAVIIGTQTFGKGVVNTPIRLSDGSGMIVTTARWYTPNGRQIGKVGITPDVLVERTPEDIAAGRDPQLAKALELLTLQSNAGRSAWGAGTQAGEQRTGLGVEAVRAG